MLITTASIVLNMSIGFATWQSQLQLFSKIVISALLLGKIVLFFFSVWMSDGEKLTRWGVTACILLDVALLAYAVVVGEMFMALTIAGAVIPLLIWALASVYDFHLK